MKQSGFTLMELLIVVALIVILAGLVLLTNVSSSLKKARDSTRKNDLNKLARIFEDYYNDHSRYPTNNSATGIIEGVKWGDPFLTYPINLPKDPSSPSQDYYYETDSNNQSYYAIYSRLENTADDDIITVGCQDGCGPNLLFNYVIHSTNVQMIAGIPSGNSVGYPGFGEPPTATPGPTSTPVPTIQLIPPDVELGACINHEPCGGRNCGAIPEHGGAACVGNEICYWETLLNPARWECAAPTPTP